MSKLKKLFTIPLLIGLITFVGVLWQYPGGVLSSDQPAKLSRPVVSHFHKITPDLAHTNPQHKLSVNCIKDKTAQSTVLLTVNTDTAGNGEKVTVKWERSTASLFTKEWIGLYCPRNGPPDSFFNYWLVQDSPTHLHGYGEVDFVVYNTRVDCEFRYYSNESCITLLSRSNPLKFKGGADQPMHGHIALTGNPSEMRVQWTSATKATPTVRYGYSASDMNRVAKGTSRTYTVNDMCTKPAIDPKYFIDPGFLHDVLLTDLKPDTTVFYQFGSANSTSRIYNFTTSPPPGSNKGFSFITYGDMGMSNTPGAQDTMLNTMKEIKNGADLVLHQGDLSYAVGHAYIWEAWMNLIEPIATRVPYMVGIGNHEQDYSDGTGNDGFHPSWGNYGDDSGGECGVPTRYRFHMPDNGNSLYWYSFNYGPVHFTFISTEHNFTTGSIQYDWLRKDFASVDRQKTPWLIVLGHRPMYTSEDYPSDYKVSIHLQTDGLEDLFHQYRVDMALWGHYHSYERTCKVYKQKCTDTGVVNIVIGAAGASLDSASQYKVEWSRHLEMNFGYGRVTVANESALFWEYVRNVDSVVSDSVWITK